jgi:3-oxoadipate enol-lactonase
VASVEFEGVDLYWEASGEGDPLLLIQGLGFSCDMWYRLVPKLEVTHRVVRYDARGVGRSTVPDGPYPIEQMARDALAVLDAAGAERAHVVGVSLGGIVAQELAVSQPARVRTLTLLATHPGGTDVVPPDPEVLMMLAGRHELEPEAAIRAGISAGYHPSTPTDAIDEDVRRRLAIPTSPVGYGHQLQGGLGYTGALSRLGSLRMPVLVVAGDSDRTIPPANSHTIAAAIEQARLVVLEDTGHVVFTERPDEIVDLITGLTAEASA